jgi:CHAD domain-containing protein
MARNANAPAESGRLKGKSSVGEAFRRGVAMSDANLARLRANGDVIDPKTVHHFRTTIRRLRSLLSSFKEVSPATERKAFSHRLKDLSQRYAVLRQWDAFIESTSEGNAHGSYFRTRQLLAEAAKMRRRAIAGSDQPLVHDIAAIDRAIGSADWLQEPAGGDSHLWNERIDEYATELLDKQWRKLRKSSRRLDLADSPSFHKFRIAAKKHRYTIEILGSLYRKREVKPYLQRVVALQDVLGDMRDAMVAGELIGELDLPPAVRASARKWLERRAAECRRRFPTHSKAFRRETPFWER